MKIIALAAAVTVALTATVGIAAEPQQRFVHDGDTYVFTQTEQANGRTVIEGRRHPANAPFRLVVRGDHVTGTVDGRRVSFRAPARSTATVLAAK